ncbi:hypothetical protein [Bradymonas sediminis]|uniref:hypothetical protein n=1 Tax=Bradymonas sediminis TaxID=1548548 RepID=UPI00105FFF92|nr:hypothetical protein [Bradymonas sediminis]TDP76024.1 hypothetical protein DFR33_103374 [Bradymonas sediminis]
MTIQKFILSTLFAALTLVLGGCVSDIMARKYNKDETCWGTKQVVGSDWGPSGCDQMMVLATDSNGDYWLFSDSCIEDGYEPVDDNNVKGELLHAPQCND